MARTRTATATRRPVAPTVPRRVSGPIRPGHPRPVTALPPRIVAPAPARPQRTTGVSERLRALPDHRWLDGLLRSRAWIWLIGIALGGIVAMQVSLLSMNAGIGRDVQTSSDLQHANAKLSEQVAELSGGERIGLLAGEMGLLSPAAGDVGYLTVRPGTDAVRAAQNMTAPSAAARARMTAPAATTTTTAPVSTAPVTTTAPATTTAPDPATTAAPAATATPAPVTTPVPTPAATAAPVTETPPVTEPVNSTAGAVAAPAG